MIGFGVQDSAGRRCLCRRRVLYIEREGLSAVLEEALAIEPFDV